MSVKNKICKACDALSGLPVIGAMLRPKDKVALIRMSGVIGGAATRRGGISMARFEKLIEEAFDTYNLRAVALILNSPGGSPAQSALLGNLLRRKAEEKEVPLYAFVEDVAASGGYWLACAADEIYASEVSIVGSIGVISSSFGFKDLIERHGVERRIHTAGKDKSFLDPFTAEKPADVKRLKALQDELHESFIGWVKARRGEKLKGTDKALFEGDFWCAKTALELGLIDGFGEAHAAMKDKYGKDVRFVEPKPDKNLISCMFGGDARSHFAQDLIETLETKALWARFGV